MAESRSTRKSGKSSKSGSTKKAGSSGSKANASAAGAKRSSAKSNGAKSSSAKSSSAKSSSAKSGSKSTAKSSSAKSRSAKSTARSSSSKSTAKSTSAKSGGATRASTKRQRSAAGKKGGQARARQQASKSSSRAAEVSAKSPAEFSEALRKNLIRPLDLVMLSRERIEEVLSEAVERGRMTADDAQGIASGLLELGRRQTNDVLNDLERLMGLEGARKAAGSARGRAVRAGAPALAQVDRARRVVGVGPSFPITGYDDLTGEQIQDRLEGLSAPELRKVRDYERRNDDRKTVLEAIESKLR
ncbi:MAG TPA: hypothetical protein VEQ61_08535 [Thermoleophilaceae bacterium]|nr:hypothetical protein [Thermoleophilaceae bacterium]